MTASAFSLSEGYSLDQFRLVSGGTVIGGIHGPSRHYHCDYCKSWLYTEPEGVEGFVNVRSTMFDMPRSQKPFIEVFIGEALPWAAINAEHKYEALPEREEWPALIEKFVATDSATMKEANR